MSANDGKPCRKCGANDWYAHGDCVPCKRERERKRITADPQTNRDRVKRWRLDNPEKKKAADKSWTDRNYARKIESNKRYQNANREKINERGNRWYKDNRDTAKERNKRWTQANKSKTREYVQRRRARRRGNGGSYTAAEWKALCNQYDNHCIYPGCERTDLTPDHIVPVVKGGSSDISNIQPLCLHHNCSKNDKTIDYRPHPGLLRWIQNKLFG